MIGLEEIVESDLKYIRELRNKNREYFFYNKEIDKETHMKWWRKYIKKKPTHYLFFLIKKDGVNVGTISIDSTSRGNELGNVIIEEQYRGKGYLKEAINILSKSFYNIYLKVKPDNTSAVEAYKKCGFKSKSLIMEL